MDVLKDISGLGDKDIVVSLVKDKSWLEYLSYFMDLRKDGHHLNIVVSTTPKTSPGRRCFIIFDGFLRGFMEISKIKETLDNEICIELIPFLLASSHKLPMADVEDFKYFFDNSNTQ